MISVQRLLQAAENSAKTWKGLARIQEIRLYDDYVEPGYSLGEGKQGIALGNWNEITGWDENTRRFQHLDDVMVRLGKILDAMGWELEWDDEWEPCYECDRLVRTAPNSYSWMASYVEVKGQITCEECLKADDLLVQEYLESLEGSDHNAVTLDLDFKEYGYILLRDDLEHGLYGGQRAHPGVIAESLRERGVDRFIFALDSVGQFDCSFSVWVHKDQVDLLGDPEDLEFEGEDPAQIIQRQFEEVARQLAEAEIPEGSFPYIRVGGESPEIQVISQEDFVRGLKP